MACRNRPNEATSHTYTEPECGIADWKSIERFPEQLIEGRNEFSRGLNSNPGSTVMNACGAGNTQFVQINYHVHLGVGTGGARNGVESPGASNGVEAPGPKRFEGNKPPFGMVTSVRGVDFGKKAVRRLYKVQKHVDPKHNLVTYSPTSSTLESTAHALKLGFSSKRATHVIFLFDSTELLETLTSAWPFHIRLQDVKTCLHKLGSGFECTKRKVRKDHFSVYLFAVKPAGDRLSQPCFETWIQLFYWAHNLQTSPDNINEGLSSFFTSPQAILETGVKASLILLGALTT